MRFTEVIVPPGRLGHACDPSGQLGAHPPLAGGRYAKVAIAEELAAARHLGGGFRCRIGKLGARLTSVDFCAAASFMSVLLIVFLKTDVSQQTIIE